ncbi:MAG: small multi-drug export protein [Candidatus Cloacimonadaceae bacterium]|nr:small multi-drug export protein [Candidatus Cloacimonadota bacterium]MDY0126943.1 small multi-drug export protein [Candidatus Cloacimonadaceae bacterium]MCB5254987.1 small multi-drug export protein [Candidatus Cloacimonadota bacterium]MCK9177572.1 small multi-drug export protein [Candidatus Cloacimonadota bacterium]MCK9242150.1 small multi-drug export protein [Candidatus Cloacimonadota bacterium]
MIHKKTKIAMIILLLMVFASGLYAASIADNTVSWLDEKGLSPRLIVFIISMLPIIELRGSIPVAIMLFKIPWFEAVIISILGNMVPIPFLLLFIEWFFKLISKVPIGARFTSWLFARTRRKGKAIERYEAIGLVSFVGIPLPGTGGWTGSLASRIFGISFWKSMLYILLGVCLASAIVTPLSLMGKLAVH